MLNLNMDLANLQQSRQAEQNLLAKNTDGSLTSTGKDFEAVFITQMLQPMFEGLESDGLFSGGQSEKIYRSMLLDQYGKMMAEHSRIGIADAVNKEMLRLQEVQSQ